MLRTLKISNIALIDELELSLEDGMNCLTGETGAGKSIIVDSIGMLSGGRVSRDLIRTGEDSGSVYGIFTDISEMTSEALSKNMLAPYSDGNVHIEREITASGRTICKVNGKNVSGAVLKEVCGTLIDIHGQHDSQSLIRIESHIKLLDSFGRKSIAPLLSEYSERLKEFKMLRKQLSDLSGDPKTRERTVDLLKYQLAEISNAQLTEGEEEELMEKRNFFNNSEKISSLLRRASEIVSPERDDSDGILSRLQEVSSILSHLSEYGNDYKTAFDNSEDILLSLEELSHFLKDLCESSVYDAEEADWVNRRLDYIYMLEKKYGNTIHDILEYADEIRKKLEFLNDSEENARIISERLGVLSGELYGICAELHEARMSVSDILSDRICRELSDLEMNGVQFGVSADFQYENDDEGYPCFGPRGLDDVEFLISPNRGEPLKPLSHIASGGELSRIMLAVKSILSESDKISTMIFDEIDTGVSGIAAKKIADKLHLISDNHQVICVTHHAQIAARADNQLFISKKSDSGRTLTSVASLSGEARVREIARLLDGNPDSEITLKHAETLLGKQA